MWNASCLISCNAVANSYVALQCSLQTSCGRSLSRAVSWKSSSPPLPSRKFPCPSCMWTTGILQSFCTCSRDARTSNVSLQERDTKYMVLPGLVLSSMFHGVLHVVHTCSGHCYVTAASASTKPASGERCCSVAAPTTQGIQTKQYMCAYS